MTAMSAPQIGPLLPSWGEMSRDHGDFPIFEDALCDPYGGPTTIAWLLAFLGFLASNWDTLNR